MLHTGAVPTRLVLSVSQVRVRVIDILTCARLTGKPAEVGGSFRVPVVMVVLSEGDITDDKQLSWSMPL